MVDRYGILDGGDSTSHYWLRHAIENIYSDYGDKVSVEEKSKDLLKFGRNANVTTVSTTIMALPSGINNETYLGSNSINSIVTTESGATQTIKIEGHTIDGNGDFTFVVQEKALTGQTAASLDTSLARCTRLYNNDTSEITGTVSATETDTYTGGVPNTDSKVHCQIPAGKQQSEKASTTISKDDYWIVTKVYGSVLEKTSAFAEIELQVREKGKVFRQKVTVAASSDGGDATHNFQPYLVIPKNADVRLVAVASGASIDVSGGIEGVLAKII